MPIDPQRHEEPLRGAVAPCALAAAAAALSIAAGALLLTASAALADGGIHVAGSSSGSSTLTTDTCAACHRAHTAQGAYLLRTSSEEALCLSCHGSAGVGATTDVETGIQYKSALASGSAGQDETDATVVAGALRSGGFLRARIGSATPSRISYPRFDGTTLQVVADFSGQVPVLAAGAPVTSAHLALDGSGIAAHDVAWGNGLVGSGAGPQVALECTSCHNPHGNGHYRILNPIPAPRQTGSTAFVTADPAANVTDAALPSVGNTRNYTVKYGLLLSDVSATSATDGDYWRRREPWDWVPTYDPANPLADSHGIVPAPSGGGHTGDRPNALTTFPGEISAWCAACHTRYLSGGSGPTVPSGDPVYAYRHVASSLVTCTQCHVAHGSNATMPGASSSAVPYPGELTGSASSRLLKVTNRGTCDLCHDPTGTESYLGVVRP